MELFGVSSLVSQLQYLFFGSGFFFTFSVAVDANVTMPLHHP